MYSCPLSAGLALPMSLGFWRWWSQPSPEEQWRILLWITIILSSSNSVIWDPPVEESVWVYFNVSSWAAAFWLLPIEGWAWSHRLLSHFSFIKASHFLGSNSMGLTDPSHGGAGQTQAQAGNATGTWPWGRSWNQPSPALAKVSPGQP